MGRGHLSGSADEVSHHVLDDSVGVARRARTGAGLGLGLGVFHGAESAENTRLAKGGVSNRRRSDGPFAGRGADGLVWLKLVERYEDRQVACHRRVQERHPGQSADGIRRVVLCTTLLGRIVLLPDIPQQSLLDSSRALQPGLGGFLNL